MKNTDFLSPLMKSKWTAVTEDAEMQPTPQNVEGKKRLVIALPDFCSLEPVLINPE